MATEAPLTSAPDSLVAVMATRKPSFPSVRMLL